MSRVNIQKLQAGNKIETPKPNLFKTARGNINWDQTKGDIITLADRELEALGIPKENISQAREYLGEYLNAIDQGQISELNNERKFVGTANFKDYSNYQQQTSGSSFWGNKKPVWDEDALRNATGSFLAKRLESASLYKEAEEPGSNKTKNKKSVYEYTWEPFQADVSKAAFRGGDWDQNTWNQWGDSDKLKYTTDVLRNRLGYLEGLSPEELENTDFSATHGYNNANDYISALRNTITQSERGVADDALFDSYRQVGLGGLRNWWNQSGSNSTNQTSDTPWTTNPNLKNYTVSGGTDFETGARIAQDAEGNSIYITQDASGNWNPLSGYVYSNPFNRDTWNRAIHNGRLYNSYDELASANPNEILSNYADQISRNERRGGRDSYINLNDSNFLYRNNSVLTNPMTWEDGLDRSAVADRSSVFSETANPNARYRLYSFGNSENIGNNDIAIIRDDRSGEQKKVKIEGRNGVYFGTDAQGNKYNLGTLNKEWDSNPESDFRFNDPDYNQAMVLDAASFRSPTVNTEDDLYRYLEIARNFGKSDIAANALQNYIDNVRPKEDRFYLRATDLYDNNNPISNIIRPLVEQFNIRPSNPSGIEQYRFDINDLINYYVTGTYLTPEQRNSNPENNQSSGRTAASRTWLGNVTNRKEGGKVPKYQFGGTNYTPKAYQIGAQPTFNPTTSTDQRNLNTDTFSSAETWGSLTGAEKTRFVASIADLGSLAVSFVPGANIGAAAVGAGSSIARFGAGVAEDGLDWGDVGELGLNLGLDAVSLIPGAKLAKAAKSAKSLVSILPKLLPVGMAIYTGADSYIHRDELIDALSRVANDPKSISTADLQRIATAVGALASGRASLKTLPNVKLGNKDLKDFNSATRNIFYSNKPGVASTQANVNISTPNGDVRVPISKGTADAYRNVSKSGADSFNDRVRSEINSTIDSYTTKDASGNIVADANAPDWAKSIISKGKTGDSWDFDMSKDKTGRIPGLRKEVTKVDFENTTSGGQLRRIFRPGAIDTKTQEFFENGGYNGWLGRRFNNAGGNQGASITAPATSSTVTTSTSTPSATPAVTPRNSSVTGPVATNIAPNGRIVDPRPVSSLNNHPSRLGVNIGEAMKGAQVGEMRNIKVGNQHVPLIMTENGIRQLSTPQYAEIIRNKAMATRQANKNAREDRKNLGEEIGNRIAARNAARERLDRYTLGQEIGATRESRLSRILSKRTAERRMKEVRESNEKTRMLTERRLEQSKQNRQNVKATNDEPYQAVTRNKNKVRKPKKQSRDDRTTRKELGGILKAQGGLRFNPLGLGTIKTPAMNSLKNFSNRNYFPVFYGNQFGLNVSGNNGNTTETTSNPVTTNNNEAETNVGTSSRTIPKFSVNATPEQIMAQTNDQTLRAGLSTATPTINSNTNPNINTPEEILAGGNTEIPNEELNKWGVSDGLSDIVNNKFRINPSSLLAAGTLGLGLQYNKKAYDAAKNIKAPLVTAPQLNARTPRGNLLMEQMYRRAGQEGLRRMGRNVTSDGNLNTGMMLEATRQSNELTERGALANDQEIRRTTELADRITGQNTMARQEAANQNTAALTNLHNLKSNAKAQYIGSKWSNLISPYLTEMRNNFMKKEAIGQQLALQELNGNAQNEYNNEMMSLQDRLATLQRDYTDKTIPFTSSSGYRNVMLDRNRIQNSYRDKILGNQKSVFSNYLAKGGIIKSIEDFNKRISNMDKVNIKSIKDDMKNSEKTIRYNTKLAKNLIFKSK